jgi:hypothetical protein
MKKLISVLAIAALAMSAAFAAYDVDWEGNNRQYIENGDDLGFFALFEDNDFSGDTLDFALHGESVGDEWLLNPNDELTLFINGLDDMDWSFAGYVAWGDDGIQLEINATKGDMDFDVPVELVDHVDFYNLPDGFTLTGQDLIDWGVPNGAGINGITLYIVNGEADYNSYDGMPVYMFGTLTMYEEEQPEEPDEDTEVPEPATYAYAAMGLVSVLGLKRRIKK